MKPGVAKQKGAKTESMWVDWISERGVPNAERRHLSGASDKGDIAGWCREDGSKSVCSEVKSGAVLKLPQWLKELKLEMINSKADTGHLVIRPKGKPNPDDWWVVLPTDVYMKLMDEAGYLR